MAKKNKKVLEFDGKAAAAGDVAEIEGAAPAATHVFDGPLSDEQAIGMLVDLNHERTSCERRWEDAKTEASDAKKELDNASNAISQLIDRIDRQRNGIETGQPMLRTLDTDATVSSAAD